MKFNPLEFEGNLNPDLYTEWVQSLEKFFEIKEHYEEKAFNIVVLNSRSMPLFAMKTPRGKEANA